MILGYQIELCENTSHANFLFEEVFVAFRIGGIGYQYFGFC